MPSLLQSQIGKTVLNRLIPEKPGVVSNPVIIPMGNVQAGQVLRETVIHFIEVILLSTGQIKLRNGASLGCQGCEVIFRTDCMGRTQQRGKFFFLHGNRG